MALLPDTDRAGLLVGVLAVHPGDLGMCELASGEVVPISVDSLPVKPRRGASVRIDSLSGRAGPVVALHPLRASSGEEPADVEDGEADAVVQDPGADLDTGAESPGETQAELEL